MKTILKTSLAIIIIGTLPLLIGGILSDIGVIEIGSGLGLALLMLSSFIISILYLISGSIIMGIKKLMSK